MHMEKEIDMCKEQVAEKKGQMLCPSCGAGVPKEASFCMYCGAPLPEKKEEKPEDADFTEVPEDAFEPEDEPGGKKPKEAAGKDAENTAGSEKEAAQGEEAASAESGTASGDSAETENRE